MSSKRNFSFTTLVVVALLATATLQQCPNNDPYCSFCMGSQCVGCNGASLVNGACVAPAQTVNNCVTFGTNGTCTTCNLGFYLNNGVCVENPGQGCAVYSLAGGCTGCFNNVRAISGNCTNNGTNGVLCNDANCDVCLSTGTCQYCSRGYVLESTNNTCVSYDQGYDGCLRVSGGVCTACRYGFYYRNNNCTGSSLIWTNTTGNGTGVNTGVARTAATLLFGTFVAFLFA